MDHKQPPGAVLDEQELAILELERSWWTYAGSKDAAIHEAFAMTSVRYYQVLNALIDRPAAMAADPLVVRRLIRLREQRRARRPEATIRGGARRSRAGSMLMSSGRPAR